MGLRGPRPKGRVNTTWRSELAYAIGLITADGSLSSNQRHINFTSKDLQLVKVFQNCLDLSNIKIGSKTRAKGVIPKYYQIQFGDVLFHRWLHTIGLTCKKSLTLSKVNIPNEYFFDFVRGEWDGDGTIICCKDHRWKNSFTVSIGFSSGSKRFVKWLQHEINKRLNTTGHIQQGRRSYDLRYGRADSQKLFEAMFYAEGLPCLERKFAKAQKILTMTGLIKLSARV